MRFIRRLFVWDPTPTWSRLPVALLHVVASGAITGPPISVFLLLMAAPSHTEMLSKPLFYFYSARIGVIFSLAFYLTCVIPQGFLRSVIAGWGAGRARFVRALAGAVGGMAGIAAAIYGVQYILAVQIQNLYPMRQILVVDAIIGAVLAVLIGAWVQKDITTAKAQVKALQAQMNPHFFFNTLNTVQSLIDTDQTLAKQVIGRLSTMSRYTLAASQQSNVRLSQEIDFIRDYLEIERARFGDRLRYALPPVDDDFQIPGLLLQPLVENAVRYGIAKRIDGGEVRVEIASENGGRIVRVRNPSEGHPDLRPERLYRPGHALANVRDRLQLTYRNRARLVVEQRGDQVEASIFLPG